MAKKHLNTATAELHELVDSFYADWLSQRLDAKDKTEWPMLMESAEWWEQFIVWTQESKQRQAVDA